METNRAEPTDETLGPKGIQQELRNHTSLTECRLRHKVEDVRVSDPGVNPWHLSVPAASNSTLDNANLLEVIPLRVEPDDGSPAVALARAEAVEIVT